MTDDALLQSYEPVSTLSQSTVLVRGFDYCCLFFTVNELIVQTQLSTTLASLHHPQLALPTLARPRGRVFKSLHGVNIHDTTNGSLNKSSGYNIWNGMLSRDYRRNLALISETVTR
jgi:hypothetical protein